MSNKLFKGTKILQNNLVSRVRSNREYLISQEISEDLNTYNYFGVFKSYNDIHKRTFKGSRQQYKKYSVKKGKDNEDKITHTMSGDEDTVGVIEEEYGKNPVGSPAVRSIFNRSGGMLIGTDGGLSGNYKDVKLDEHIRDGASGWRISNNVPLMDSPGNRDRIRSHSGCSVKELVQQSEQGLLGRAIYSYADFMYCKYLGKVPNNYLITLRRFPVPPGDFISTVGVGRDQKVEGKNSNGQQIGCMVTWLGTPGNEIGNILKYSYKMPYQEKTAQWEPVENSDADGAQGLANSVAAAFDPAYRKQYISGHGGAAYNAFVGKFFKVPGLGKVSGGSDTGPYRTSPFYDANKIYGPIDRVKSTMMRSPDGLEFNQEVTITFEYELRAYNGINTRQAMLDLLSNILQVTYTTGGFWGGGYRGGGMHQSSIFNNLAIFKCHGGFTDFMDAFAKDYSTVSEKIRGNIAANGGFLSALKSLLNQLGGLILGGALNQLGRPQRTYANSLLSEQPVGMWHLMVGNPNHPIISVGNMVLMNTEVQHYGPLGLDDFPTNLKVTCTLKRGKPRDLREIEKMYMHGNDRIYFSMGPKVMDMYKVADEYKKRQEGYRPVTDFNSLKYDLQTQIDYANLLKSADIVEADAETISIASVNDKGESIIKDNEAEAKELGAVFLDKQSVSSCNVSVQKWFGETDSYSIYFAAAEQENGASKKKENASENNKGK